MVAQQQLQSQRNPESSLKRKSQAGKQQLEPKLESKYRQISRHTIGQALEDISGELDG